LILLATGPKTAVPRYVVCLWKQESRLSLTNRHRASVSWFLCDSAFSVVVLCRNQEKPQFGSKITHPMIPHSLTGHHR